MTNEIKNNFYNLIQSLVDQYINTGETKYYDMAKNIKTQYKTLTK